MNEEATEAPKASPGCTKEDSQKSYEQTTVLACESQRNPIDPPMAPVSPESNIDIVGIRIHHSSMPPSGQ
jgi:hypothetical protein